jgi:hypothetical protein
MMVMVMVGVMASTVTATADDGPIAAAAGTTHDRWVRDLGDRADHDGERGDQTPHCQPTRGGCGQRFRESIKAIRVHPRSRARTRFAADTARSIRYMCRGTSWGQNSMWMLWKRSHRAMDLLHSPMRRFHRRVQTKEQALTA